jgi:putative two-component system response regulator
LRTLIVDDEPEIRSLAAKILTRSGTVCQMAGSAEEALLRVGREPFDVVVIDIRLPGLSGLELARRLQQREPDTALLMLTGTTDPESVIAAMQAGAADYVTKPFTPQVLLDAFGRAVERRRVRLDANRAAGLRQAIVERTLEMQLLLADTRGDAGMLVQSYLAALRLRDAAAAAHAERVARLAAQLGARLALTAPELEALDHAALLHDIGKALLPETVLSRPGGLSSDDIQLVRRHPEYGYDVVRQIPAIADCAPALLAQLEHWDGTGTPFGRRGEAVPVEARIIAVANAFDVMTHPRPHAELRSTLDAVREVENCQGTIFDPDVVDALLAQFDLEPRPDDWPDSLGEDA